MIDDIDITWVQVEAGNSYIGCNPDQVASAEPDEQPRFMISLSEFWITKYPITNRVWNTVASKIGLAPRPSCDDIPVTFVTWNDCHEFAARISSSFKLNVSLPSEFQWEKAVRGLGGAPILRGGVYEEFPLDLAEMFSKGALNVHNADFELCGYGVSNVWMNVSEWCENWYCHDSYLLESNSSSVNHEPLEFKAIRGGNPLINGWPRITSRSFQRPEFASPTLGFRLIKLEE